MLTSASNPATNCATFSYKTKNKLSWFSLMSGWEYCVWTTSTAYGSCLFPISWVQSSIFPTYKVQLTGKHGIHSHNTRIHTLPSLSQQLNHVWIWCMLYTRNEKSLRCQNLKKRILLCLHKLGAAKIFRLWKFGAVWYLATLCIKHMRSLTHFYSTTLCIHSFSSWLIVTWSI